MSPEEKARFIGSAAFLKRRSPGLRSWQRGNLLRMLGWYWADGRVGTVRHAGRVVAVATARSLRDAAEAADPWAHHEDGRILWVEDIASTHPDGIRALLHLVVQRFGPRETLAGRVFNRAGDLRMIPWNNVERWFLN